MSKIRQFALLTVIAVVGLFASGYMLLVKPKSADVDELASKTADQKRANTKLAGQIQTLNAQAKQLPAVQAELAAIAKQLPATPELPALIRAITAAADDAGLMVMTLAPEPPALVTPAGTAVGTAAGSTTATGGATSAATAKTGGSDVLAAIPVEIKIRGGYHNMQLFFANIENLPRSFVLHKFSIKEIKGKGDGMVKAGDIDATLNGRVFMAVPLTALPAPKAPAAAKTEPVK